MQVQVIDRCCPSGALDNKKHGRSMSKSRMNTSRQIKQSDGGDRSMEAIRRQGSGDSIVSCWIIEINDYDHVGRSHREQSRVDEFGSSDHGQNDRTTIARRRYTMFKRWENGSIAGGRFSRTAYQAAATIVQGSVMQWNGDTWHMKTPTLAS